MGLTLRKSILTPINLISTFTTKGEIKPEREGVRKSVPLTIFIKTLFKYLKYSILNV